MGQAVGVTVACLALAVARAGPTPAPVLVTAESMPSPKPTTQIVPTAEGLIKTLTQGQTSRTYTFEPNSCVVFQVAFDGGNKRKFEVDVTDSNKGLAYIAAGLAWYNKKEVTADPYTLERCDKRFDFDTADGSVPQCWGFDYDDVDTSGYEKASKCDGKQDAMKKELGHSTATTFKFRGSSSQKCMTKSGDYYLYVYAKTRTSVTLYVYDGSAKSSCKNNHVSKTTAIIIGVIVSVVFVGAVISCIVFCIFAARNNRKPENHQFTEYGNAPPEYTSPPVAGPVQYETPAHGQLEQPKPGPYGNVVQGQVVGNDVQGQVVGIVGTPVASAPPYAQAY